MHIVLLFARSTPHRQLNPNPAVGWGGGLGSLGIAGMHRQTVDSDQPGESRVRKGRQGIGARERKKNEKNGWSGLAQGCVSAARQIELGSLANCTGCPLPGAMFVPVSPWLGIREEEDGGHRRPSPHDSHLPVVVDGIIYRAFRASVAGSKRFKRRQDSAESTLQAGHPRPWHFHFYIVFYCRDGRVVV